VQKSPVFSGSFADRDLHLRKKAVNDIFIANIDIISRKRALYLVALLRTVTCTLARKITVNVIFIAHINTISRKRVLYLVALWRKETCILRHPACIFATLYLLPRHRHTQTYTDNWRQTIMCAYAG